MLFHLPRPLARHSLGEGGFVTELGLEGVKYAGVEEADEPQRKLDVFEQDGQWWFAGVPRSEDWLRVHGMLEQKGVSAKFSHVE